MLRAKDKASISELRSTMLQYDLMVFRRAKELALSVMHDLLDSGLDMSEHHHHLALTRFSSPSLVTDDLGFDLVVFVNALSYSYTCARGYELRAIL
jgi:hypothetical protein